MYAIIDIETNGLNNYRGKITEIAIFKHDGNKIIDEYQTLINPEGVISEQIQRLTGISNHMVLDAPKFYEIANDILDFTEGCVFVAHNVNFDYCFIQREFKELGYTYSRKKVCTVKQSRLLLPGHKSYSLGKLCNDLNIQINGRHRAGGDAEATVKLFEILLGVDKNLGLNKKIEDQLSKYLHPSLDLAKVLEAPKSTGVYYLYNEKKEVIYVGKSINIRTRLYNHLRQPKTQKAIQMHTEVADVDFEITGSELASLLLESQEIKRLKPKFNRALKRDSFPYGVYQSTDLFGYIQLNIEKTKNRPNAITTFPSIISAKKSLEELCTNFDLCSGLSAIQKCDRGCILHSIKKCAGAALCEENSADYNLRVNKAINYLNPLKNKLLVFEKSNIKNELWAILIEGQKFVGMTKFNTEYELDLTAVIDAIPRVDLNPDNDHIIASFLRKNKPFKLIDLDQEKPLSTDF
ncbi:MAG: exonuclease domain-containing protein [Salibacteraceae bacterium]